MPSEGFEPATPGSERPQTLALDSFFFKFSCSLFVLYRYLFLCFDGPGFCLFVFTYKHNTSIHAPAGIRTRIPSKRSAPDPRLRPLGHWDRQGFDTRTIQPVASRYTGPVRGQKHVFVI